MLCDLSSPRTSGIFAYMYLTQCLSLSLFGASAAAYLGDIIPAYEEIESRLAELAKSEGIEVAE